MCPHCKWWVPLNKAAINFILCHLAAGRIRATQLDYSEAHRHLLQVMARNKESAECLSSSVVLINFPLPHSSQAIRKAPQHSAIGFKQTAHKFAVVVQLLLGEIPDRATFREPILQRPLIPYLQLTQGRYYSSIHCCTVPVT